MKKKFRSRIVAALVAVTALTCCFVGSTFAKYTSSADKTATATVAHWEITNISENGGTKNNFQMQAEKLSPDFQSTTNKLESAELTITNKSDVSAKISWTTENGVVVTYRKDETGASLDKNWKTAYGTLATVEDAVFTCEITGSTDNSTPDTVTKDTTNVTLEPNKTLTLKLTLYWNTQADTANVTGDEIDTFFGMYADKLNVSFAFKAEQASKLPA